jgi:hypothetical protein
VGFVVAGSFVSAEYEKTSWMGIALMFCLLPLARSQKPVKQVEEKTPIVRIEEDFVAHEFST